MHGVLGTSGQAHQPRLPWGVAVQYGHLMPLRHGCHDQVGPRDVVFGPRVPSSSMNPLVDLRGRLSRHEIRSKLDELAQLIEGFRVESVSTPPPPGHRPRWWRLSDRLDKTEVEAIAEDRLQGMTYRQLVGNTSSASPA